jgi:hypothetical protein
MSDDDPPTAGAAAPSMNRNTVVISMAPTAEPKHRANPTAIPAV